MAQSGFTPISLYYSSTVSTVPLAGDLAFGELAININDGKLYYKSSVGVVTLLASTALAGGSFTTLSYSTSLTGVGTASMTANSTNPALRVTQTGTGNAFEVEDSATPDATPFVIDQNGLVLMSNNLTFNALGQRITSDFSNATLANRLSFQSSVSNGATGLGVLPNGASLSASVSTFGSSDPDNTSSTTMLNTGTEGSIRVGKAGTGTYYPLTFYTNNVEALRVETSGAVTLKVAALQELKRAIAAAAIDVSSANYFSKTISATTTFTVSGVPTTGTATTFILDLTNGGAFTLNWWSGIKWVGGVSPVLTVAGRDVLGFFTYDGGTTWTGLVLGKDVK